MAWTPTWGTEWQALLCSASAATGVTPPSAVSSSSGGGSASHSESGRDTRGGLAAAVSAPTRDTTTWPQRNAAADTLCTAAVHYAAEWLLDVAFEPWQPPRPSPTTDVGAVLPPSDGIRIVLRDGSPLVLVLRPQAARVQRLLAALSAWPDNVASGHADALNALVHDAAGLLRRAIEHAATTAYAPERVMCAPVPVQRFITRFLQRVAALPEVQNDTWWTQPASVQAATLRDVFDATLVCDCTRVVCKRVDSPQPPPAWPHWLSSSVHAPPAATWWEAAGSLSPPRIELLPLGTAPSMASHKTGAAADSSSNGRGQETHQVNHPRRWLSPVGEEEDTLPSVPGVLAGDEASRASSNSSNSRPSRHSSQHAVVAPHVVVEFMPANHNTVSV